jgi:hypothetical protein
VDLFAPGTCIRSFGSGTQGEGYKYYSGTSQAAPLVAFAAALLYELNTDPAEIKYRLLSAVDAGKEFAESISRGTLNIAKALDFFDDIVVFKAGEYVRGRLVQVTAEGQYIPSGDVRLCATPDAGVTMTSAHDTMLRGARRMVVSPPGVDQIQMMSVVPFDKRRFEYSDCKPYEETRLRLEDSSGCPLTKDFGFADVLEIVPRAQWLPPEPSRPKSANCVQK